MIRSITILGGGASGLTAAINLARKGYNVTILELKPRIGQKILVTGNGRCNLSNLDIQQSNYHSDNLDTVQNIIARYSNTEVLDFFNSIGLFTRSKGDLVYPLSNKASSVVDLFRAALAKYDVEIITDFEIKDVCRHSDTGYYCIKRIQGKSIKTTKLIIATGLMAHDGTDIGLKILKKFGHSIKRTYPALVQLKSADAFLKGLKGVKFIGEISVRQNGEILRAERGEILITDYGISGIAVMQLSYLFSLYDNCTAELDFVPDMSFDEVKKNLSYLNDFYKNSVTLPNEYLTGLVDKKLGMRIIKHSNTTNIEVIASNLKAMPLEILGHNGFKNAQVCGGGASLDDFDKDTLESHHAKGLYATGEVLDVVGDCGGYNLHWAFASALCVAEGFND
ncbi:MAG: aminoacetone oxidase family FAD-binding enzyme [Defluviitaleaceae bacterium]|nr:aminoacetone oxidase family FAD-binding enzyme [Defluviitaleaceae bacterium]